MASLYKRYIHVNQDKKIKANEKSLFGSIMGFGVICFLFICFYFKIISVQK